MTAIDYLGLKSLNLINNSFKFFLENYIYDYSESSFISPRHTLEWADLLQNNNRVAILSARYHLKTTTVQHFLMWLVLANLDKDLEILYISYKKDMAEYHTRNLKQMISRHPAFLEIKDLTPAESILKLTVDNSHKITIEPEGILSFKRGRHPDIVICDDILADPSQELNFTVIDKIKRIFDDDISNLPKQGGKLILIGTAQTQSDLFFQIKQRAEQERTDFVFKEYKAIIDDANKKVLWPEIFSYEVLDLKRKENEKSFNKEYMCSPVWSEDSFFTREQIIERINSDLKNKMPLDKVKWNIVTAGWDIGKHQHPSHFAVFIKKEDTYEMIWQEFFDGMDYITQLEKVNKYIEMLRIDSIYFDATRGELEGFYEQGLMDKSIFNPVTFKTKTKSAMASNFEGLVIHKRVELINNERMISQILSVMNNLDAIATVDGHGDAFWSIALALSNEIKESTEGMYGVVVV